MRSLAPLVLLVAAAIAGGAVVPPGPGPSGTAQESLEPVARRVAELWERGDAAGLGELLRPADVALDLGEREHASLQARQVVAALRDLLGRQASESVRIDRFAELAGAPLRGFVELVWETVREDTVEVMRHTVFVGLERGEDRWRITEIRILR